MKFIPIFYDLIFSLFLFVLIVCSISVLLYASKHQLPFTKRTQTITLDRPYIPLFKGQHYHLACPLEDAPKRALKGQSYELAIPLMTPLVCLLEDAPQIVLKGQFYELATPLMTPLVCLLEDVPQIALKGQYYQLATPLMTPLVCLLEDAPQIALKGQFYQLATPLACILAQNLQKFYTQKLGQPGINYWEWREQPESRNVCPELSRLLNLPEPKGYAKDVLEALAGNRELFGKYSPKIKMNKEGNLSANFTDYINRGKFSERDLQVQTEMRFAFKQWHEIAVKQIETDALKAIYKVCYRTSWKIIQEIIDEKAKTTDIIIIDESAPWWKMLGVKPSANTLQVEKAYKNLIRIWHPDINKHPQATYMTSLINVAYEQYQSLKKAVAMQTKVVKTNHGLFIKIRGWIKPLFPR